MSQAIEVNIPFDDVTPTITRDDLLPRSINDLPAIHAANELDQLLNLQLPALLHAAIALENQKVNARRVDGRIIGTGEADFTKGNTLYTLNYYGKTFQLIDVPGIEGDEGKYAHIVREAVAKAHLVFYVNGTNKKPEKATAEKIRSYLRCGTQVCPIVNVRGNADAYEFDNDRESLESDGGATAALKQTTGVLESVLNREVLLPGLCVQGMLAFSSLAMHSESGRTSIHPSRNQDLVIHQQNYLKHFASANAMFEFSRMQTVAQVLHEKLGTFKEDIIESNKVKVRELLVENVGILNTTLREHQRFIERLEPEFEKCRESINGGLQTFERLVTAGRRNLWSKFFNDLTTDADEVVAEHFGDNDHINAMIKKASTTRQTDIREQLQVQLEEHMESLRKSISQAVERLIQDFRRVEFEQQITFNEGGHDAVYRAAQMDMELGLKEWGSIALNVGSYTISGAGIGSGFPIIGTAIGAIVGAVVGILVEVMQFLISKEKRIRKAQANIHEKIEEMRAQVIGRLSSDLKCLMKSVRKEVQETTLSQIDTLYSSLVSPLNIIQQQIALMSHIKTQLETMPHGTIQAIQQR